MTAQRRAEALLLSVTVIWGSTFVVTKGLLESASPLVYTAIRFLLAALIVALLFPRSILSRRQGTLLHGGVLGLLLFAGFTLQTLGLEITTASKSAFFTGMLVVFTPILHAVAQRWLPVPGKTLHAGNLAGVLLSAAGLYLLTSPGGEGFNAGDLMTLGAAAFFALYIVHLDGIGRTVDAAALSVAVFAVCGAAGGISAALFENVWIRPGPGFYLPLAYLTVFATVVSLGIQNRFQADTTPTRAAVIFSLEPVIAAAFAWVVRGEQLGAVGIAGGCTIVAGLVLSELSEQIPLLNRPIAAARRVELGGR